MPSEFFLVASLGANLVLAVWLGAIVSQRQTIDQRTWQSRYESMRESQVRLAREQSDLLRAFCQTRDRIAYQPGENRAWLSSDERADMQARARALEEEANRLATVAGEPPRGGD